jgi:molecular chaperone HscB
LRVRIELLGVAAAMVTGTQAPVSAEAGPPCPGCGERLRSPVVCHACNLLFAPAGVNHFELLGLPQRYQIDESQIRRAFRSIAWHVHPDRQAARSESERLLATRLSAWVNEAVRVLTNPAERAAYLLDLHGGPSAAQVREVAPSVLMEAMEIREQIEAARASGDLAALDRHRHAITGRKDGALLEIGKRAERLSGSSAEDRKEFRRLLNAMKYYDGLIAELAEDPLALKP